MESVYRDKIYDIAVNTFEVTCCMFPLEEDEIEKEPQEESLEEAAQSVVHFSGAADGKTVVAASGELLTAIAANMLGIEEPDNRQKKGALCEITNIICGNIVPLFARDGKICTIKPPELSNDSNQPDKTTKGIKQESLPIFLDEGTAKITVYYSI